jgi:anti-sigma regulatory factor (Ser/Thr protein kinase)/CheY-like chemotaxis protein
MATTLQEKIILAVAGAPEIDELLNEEDRPLGCSVELVQDHAELLRRVTIRAYDVILTDLRAPAEEEVALLREIHRVRPAAVVFVMAATGTAQSVIDAMREHAFGYYTRPFDLYAVREMLAQALGLSQWDNGIEVLSAHPRWITLRLRCRRLTAERLIQFCTELKVDLPAKDREDMALAFREILMNAIEHGGGLHPRRWVEVAYLRTERIIGYRISDPGPGFALDDLPHAAVSNPEDDMCRHVVEREALGMRPGGFGLLLASRLVDELIHNEQGNEVLLVKYLH